MVSEKESEKPCDSVALEKEKWHLAGWRKQIPDNS